MFTKDVAVKVSHLFNADVEREIKMILDDVLQQELNKINANTPDADLRVIAIKKEVYEKLKNYRQLLEDSRGR